MPHNQNPENMLTPSMFHIILVLLNQWKIMLKTVKFLSFYVLYQIYILLDRRNSIIYLRWSTDLSLALCIEGPKNFRWTVKTDWTRKMPGVICLFFFLFFFFFFFFHTFCAESIARWGKNGAPDHQQAELGLSHMWPKQRFKPSYL